MAEFAAVAESLRDALLDFYDMDEEGTASPERTLTIETNSSLVEQRGLPLVEMLATSGGVESLAGARLLDLGCGFGALSVLFATHGATVTGIDPNSQRLDVGRRVASKHDLSVDLHEGRMESLDLPDRSFDIVVQNNSFCYLVDRERRIAALRETLRILRPEGVLVARNPNRWNPVDQFTGLPLIHLLPPESAVRFAGLAGRRRSLCRLMSPPGARRELRRAGFVGVHQAGFTGTTRKPDVLKAFARYQHLVGRKPAGNEHTG